MGEISGERRYARRYRLQLPLRYRVVQKNQPVVSEGVGLTRDMSSGGIAFEADMQIPINAVIEVWITWPVASEDATVIELHAACTVVRTTGGEIGLKVKRHDFVSIRPGESAAGASGPRAGRGASNGH